VRPGSPPQNSTSLADSVCFVPTHAGVTFRQVLPPCGLRTFVLPQQAPRSGRYPLSLKREWNSRSGRTTGPTYDGEERLLCRLDLWSDQPRLPKESDRTYESAKVEGEALQCNQCDCGARAPNG